MKKNLPLLILLIGIILNVKGITQVPQVENQELSKFIALSKDFKMVSNNFTNSTVQPSKELTEEFNLLVAKYGSAKNFIASLMPLMSLKSLCENECYANYFRCIEGCWPNYCGSCATWLGVCKTLCLEDPLTNIKTQKETVQK